MLLIEENFRVIALKFFLSLNKINTNKRRKGNEQIIGLQRIYKGEFIRAI